MIASFQVKWTISKAQDSYGYNVCTMRGEGMKARCMGGGYDMQGTCLAQLTMQLFPAYFDGTIIITPEQVQQFYGLRVWENGTAHLNGVCGLECVERVLRELIGATVEWEWSRDRKGYKKDRIGLIISKD